MLNFVLTYLFGYIVGMFITRHIFLKIIKNVYDYGYKNGVSDSIDILRKDGRNVSANVVSLALDNKK